MKPAKPKTATFEKIHNALFPLGPPKHRTLDELKAQTARSYREGLFSSSISIDCCEFRVIVPIQMGRSEQLNLGLPIRGGKRPGAGRKPKGEKALVSHAARPHFERAMPVHVTLRMKKHVWSLRSRRCFSLVAQSFRKAGARPGMRLIEFSLQGNHLHLVVEADDNRKLSTGVQGLCIRIARALNRLMERSGKVFADHFHSRLLQTPRELTRAIQYVRNNHEHHFGEAGVDPFSSAAPKNSSLLATPVGWLLRVGRFRHPD